MVTSDIYTARNELFACLDTPIYEFGRMPNASSVIGRTRQPSWPHDSLRPSKKLEATKSWTGDSRRWATSPAWAVHTSSPVATRSNGFRCFKEASPDKQGRTRGHFEVGYADPAGERAEGLSRLAGGERLVGEAGSILWRPYELSSYCMRFAEFNKYPELPEFWHELERVLTEVRTELLWGSYLLAVSSDVHRSAQPDCYFLLEGTILRSKGVSPRSRKRRMTCSLAGTSMASN